MRKKSTLKEQRALVEIEKMKNKAEAKGVTDGIRAGLGLALMVIHDKFDLLDCENKEEVFADFYLELVDSFDKGYITLDDLISTIEEEAGIRIE